METGLRTARDCALGIKLCDWTHLRQLWGYSSVVERSLCMREASGSNPDISTFFFFLPGTVGHRVGLVRVSRRWCRPKHVIFLYTKTDSVVLTMWVSKIIILLGNATTVLQHIYILVNISIQEGYIHQSVHQGGGGGGLLQWRWMSTRMGWGGSTSQSSAISRFWGEDVVGGWDWRQEVSSSGWVSWSAASSQVSGTHNFILSNLLCPVVPLTR